MQPQGHVQLLMNLLLRGMDPQAAIDAPRFCIRDGLVDGAIALEPWLPDDDTAEKEGHQGRGGGRATAEELRRMGHEIVLVKGHDRSEMGRAQVSTCGGYVISSSSRWRQLLKLWCTVVDITD